MRGYLSSHNLHLIEAENGQEAIQMLEQFRPALILMNINMPVMDGYQATQLIKADQEFRTIPVVALTAYAMRDQRERFQSIYDGYLSKPVSRNDLIATLAEFLPHTKTPYRKEPEGVRSSLEGGRGGVQRPRVPGTGRREILEELKNYTAQTGPFPQALRDKLLLGLLPRYQKVSEVISVDAIIDFAEAIITVGDAFTILPLKHYGEELLNSIKVLDSIKVRRLLTLFPDIVEIITGSRVIG